MSKSLVILWGLPGSGKTTYAQELAPNHNQRYRSSDAVIVDGDRYRSYKGDAFINTIAGEIRDYANRVSTKCVILDCLLTTNADAIKLLLAIKEAMNANHPYRSPHNINFNGLTIKVVWWKKDIASCLHNDRGRRQKDSTITIMNMPFEEPSENFLKDFVNDVVCKEVVRKPDWKVWSEENGCGHSHLMKSDEWSLGGSCGCIGGGTYPVSAEPQPISFKEFDDVLERICPTITFMQYKKLYADCVRTETRGDSDYYGGSTEHACFVCDLEILYKGLVGLGAIKGEHS